MVCTAKEIYDRADQPKVAQNNIDYSYGTSCESNCVLLLYVS